MERRKKAWKQWMAGMMGGCMLVTLAPSTVAMAKTTAAETISYKFSGSDSATAGFAEGTITLKSKTGGNYYLYWANDKKALSGYYEIAKLTIKKGKSASFTFAPQTAIPADATKVIVIKSDNEPTSKTVAKAAAVYKIPTKKQLNAKAKDALYTFSSYSDIHIDEETWGAPVAYWQFSEKNWEQALAYSVKKKVDFIVSSGDQVTNAKYENLDNEWKAYQSILAQSDYVNPIYESSGNHEVRKGEIADCLSAYVKGSGLDSSLSSIESGKAYYTMTEPTTGDLFIFMALEGGYRPKEVDEFTDEQLDWLEKTLKENYNTGKKQLAEYEEENAPYSNIKKHQIILELYYLFLTKCMKPKDNYLELSGQIRYAQTIITYIKQHYRENLTSQMLANVVGLSPQYLSKYFKSVTRMNLMQYLGRVRVENANRELLSSDRTITEIALDNGFPNVKAYINKCKSIYGMTPVEYKKTHGSKKNIDNNGK